MTTDKAPLGKDIHFAQIPEWVLFHEGLSPQAVRLYAVLDRFSEERRWPGRKYLAERLGGVDLKTVDRALKQLAQATAVTIIPRWDENGDRTSNAYKLHVTPPEGVAPRVSPPPDMNVHRGRDTEVATGRDIDVAVERASFSTTPLPPDSVVTASACPKHRTRPHGNCKGCGTTARQIADARRRASAEQKRADDAATLQRERDARAIAARAGPSPTKKQILDDTRQAIAHTRRSNT